MQAISRDQTEEKIFVVVGNSGCHDPAPTLACCPVHAQASPTRVRSCRCVALARRNCSGIPGHGGHRLWGRFERSDFSDPNCDFNSSECCDLCGNWIDALDFRIFPVLSTALAKLALASAFPPPEQ